MTDAFMGISVGKGRSESSKICELQDKLMNKALPQIPTRSTLNSAVLSPVK